MPLQRRPDPYWKYQHLTPSQKKVRSTRLLFFFTACVCYYQDNFLSFPPLLLLAALGHGNFVLSPRADALGRRIKSLTLNTQSPDGWKLKTNGGFSMDRTGQNTPNTQPLFRVVSDSPFRRAELFWGLTIVVVVCRNQKEKERDGYFYNDSAVTVTQ